ncbi:MAG: N-acetylmuramoyl-L-alanine amidase [Oscillospiraceae bacterium]|nr:N-acetylmuramoyl-L-alanine amidase [Oscillospiraceae bacterium]
MKRTSEIQLLPIYACILTGLVFLAYWGSNAITAFHENEPISNGSVVIIDAGHGGFDGGATSYSGILESQLNLEISNRLNDLMHLLGMPTIMIRTEDVSVHTNGDTIAAKKVSDLKNRVKLVNTQKDCILVSIHQNYFTDGRYDGAQVFYSANTESRSLAETMQKTLAVTLDRNNSRKPKKANGIFLMENINTTGILIECGFLSNPSEDKLLQQPDYQKKLSAVIASVINQHIYENPIA